MLVGVILGLGLLFAAIDLRPDLSHLDAQMLSGPPQGNYFASVARLSQAASRQGGKLGNQTTAGTEANLERLAATAQGCESQFAFAQDGVAPPAGSKLELVARLKKSESLFLLGKDAARLTSFADLRGLTIGVGLAKSGTDRLVRQIFASQDFQALGMTFENHDIEEQLTRLQRGQLDLGAFVVDEDAELIRTAIRQRGLELASLTHLDVVARQHPFLWHGRIGAGQYDPVRLLPPTDKRVLRVDTLVVGNGCAGHAETIALLTLLRDEFPGLIEHNRARGGSDLLATSAAAKSFFDNQGPELAEQHVPWLVDLMPPSNWVYVVMSISVLFNIMGFGHRFRLWRIDAGRIALEQKVRDTLGKRLTPEEVHDLLPQEDHLEPAVLGAVDEVLAQLGKLRNRCRRQSVSMLVPMGQEMAYRYQEDQVEESLTALRLFRGKLAQAIEDASTSPERSELGARRR